MAVTTFTNRFLREVVEALGLKGKRVTRVVIEAEVKMFTRVTVTMLKLDELDDVTEVIKRFEIQELKPEVPVDPPWETNKTAEATVKFREFT